MESLRFSQRRIVQHLFQEFTTSSSRSLRQQTRLLRVEPKTKQPIRHSSPLLRPSFRSLNHSRSPFSAPRLQRKSLNSFSRRTVRHSSSSTTPSTPTNGSQSLSQRLKTLTREYGWAAVGVYLTLSALDFPFCFLAVRLLGAERVGHLEHQILHYIKVAFKRPLEMMGWEWGEEQVEQQSKDVKRELKEMEIPIEHAEQQEKRLLDDHGDVALATSDSGAVQKKGNEEREETASIWTQLALAYAIHKSLLIFVRVPLTAAVTPKVVKTLRGWGWNIGKRRPKGTGVSAQKGTGVNTKASGSDSS